MGRYGEIESSSRREGAPRPTRGYPLAPLEPKPSVSDGEIWGDMGRCGEIWGESPHLEAVRHQGDAVPSACGEGGVVAAPRLVPVPTS